MPGPAKFFCGLFLLCALAALGADIYIWQNSDDHPFTFAETGYLTKTYATEYHQMVVDAVTPEIFNQIFRPILQIPAVFLSLSFACLSLCFGFLAMSIKAKTKGQMAPKGQGFKYNRR